VVIQEKYEDSSIKFKKLQFHMKLFTDLPIDKDKTEPLLCQRDSRDLNQNAECSTIHK
jgi:hypothetical protein